MIERRSFAAQDLEVRSEPERILSGVLVPYGQPTRVGGYVESFQRGAFLGTEPGDVPLLRGHEHASLPIGTTLTLEDGESGLEGEWRVSPTSAGDEVLALAQDHVPLSLSIGFAPVEDRWTSDRSQVTRIKARLGEVSVVGLGAYADAKVTAVRADEDTGTIVPAPRLAVARRISR